MSHKATDQRNNIRPDRISVEPLVFPEALGNLLVPARKVSRAGDRDPDQSDLRLRVEEHRDSYYQE